MNKFIKGSVIVLIAGIALGVMFKNNYAESAAGNNATMSANAASNIVAGNYQLAPEFSSIGFATIKNQFVVEPATITSLSGDLKADGNFEVKISLSGLNTWVPIRDTRLQELFFKSVEYPDVKASGKVDMNNLKKPATKIEIPVQVTMFGTTKEIVFPVIVSTADDHIAVASTHPVIVSGSSFGIPASNLIDLANTVNGIKISDSVPLTLNLLFRKI